MGLDGGRRRNRSHTETDRLEERYRRYDSSTRYASRHDPDNSGNVAILHERDGIVRQIISHATTTPLSEARILDVGCGHGRTLATIHDWGAREELMHGVDLLEHRISQARRLYPAISFECLNAESLPYPDNHFDLLLCFNVFSSIAHLEMARRIASEMRRVLADRGSILWYDIRYPNPFNPRIRPITKRGIDDLFPGFVCRVSPVTLIPPMARHLEPASLAYRALNRFGFLRSHYLGALRAA